MKVRFLHNRKTSVINTVQIFIGLSWQHAASPLPFLIGTECPRANTTRQQQTKRVTEWWYERHWHIVNLELVSNSGKESTMWESSQLFQDLCQTLWYMVLNDSLFSSAFFIEDILFSPWRIPEPQICYFYLDKLLYTSILSDLFQYSIFILPYIKTTFLCDQEHLNSDDKTEGDWKDSNNISLKKQQKYQSLK